MGNPFGRGIQAQAAGLASSGSGRGPVIVQAVCSFVADIRMDEPGPVRVGHAHVPAVQEPGAPPSLCVGDRQGILSWLLVHKDLMHISGGGSRRGVLSPSAGPLPQKLCRLGGTGLFPLSAEEGLLQIEGRPVHRASPGPGSLLLSLLLRVLSSQNALCLALQLAVSLLFDLFKPPLAVELPAPGQSRPVLVLVASDPGLYSSCRREGEKEDDSNDAQPEQNQPASHHPEGVVEKPGETSPQKAAARVPLGAGPEEGQRVKGKVQGEGP